MGTDRAVRTVIWGVEPEVFSALSERAAEMKRSHGELATELIRRGLSPNLVELDAPVMQAIDHISSVTRRDRKEVIQSLLIGTAFPAFNRMAMIHNQLIAEQQQDIEHAASFAATQTEAQPA